MQIAAMHDVVFGSVALLEIDEGQAIVNLARSQSRQVNPIGSDETACSLSARPTA